MKSGSRTEQRPFSISDYVGLYRDLATSAPKAATPSKADEIGFLNGLNPDGSLNSNSYWGANGSTAFKYGGREVGSGATITYNFDASSGFTAQEKATFLRAFALWSSVADITFEEGNRLTANVLLSRGSDGGAYMSNRVAPGLTGPGLPVGQALISIDTDVLGFDLSGSLDRIGGYGFSTLVHEVGHLIGLGHGGDYNGNVNPATEQQSAFDDRMYTIMSYISFRDTDARYLDANPYQGTNWGVTDEGYTRQAPHTMMQLDIRAIQQLYGEATDTPFDGGEVYGFNSNIKGPLAKLFDFAKNTDPVVTLYNQGTGNTLDLSGYKMDQRVDLRPEAFSDIGGHVNNVAIAKGTVIETAILGRGNDVVQASDVASTLRGGGGADVLRGGKGADALFGGGGADDLFGGQGRDTLSGGLGADSFVFTVAADSHAARKHADVIVDFSSTEGDKIDLSQFDLGDEAFAFVGRRSFSGEAGELRYTLVGDDAFVQADLDGDGKADFMIRLEDVARLSATDFVF